MIYNDYWNLERSPFANDHRVEAFIPTSNATLVIGRLRYALGGNRGVAGLFGGPGVGKTFIAKLLLDEFREANWQTVYLPNPYANARDLLSLLNPSLAAECKPNASCVMELCETLAALAEAGKFVLLAVDDVQATRNSEFLELLRTLLNIEYDGRRALNLLLIGQAEMELRLKSASGFDSQLSVRAVVTAMDPEEAKLYILARLKEAGSKQGLFTLQAAETVVSLTHGVPRQINRLCELALVIAYGFDAKKIDPNIIKMAAADLDMLPGDETAFFAWSKTPKKKKSEPQPPEAEPAEDDILASLPAEGTA